MVDMGRIHGGIKKLLKKVDADSVANRAEDYLEAFKVYRTYLAQARGLVSAKRLRSAIQKIDRYEREILKLEEKIDKLNERRDMEALKLQDFLDGNMEVLEEYLEPDELKDF